MSSSSPALSVASTATPPVITDVQYAEPQLCASTDGKVNIKLSAAGGAYDVDLNNDGIFEKSAVAATGNDIVLSGFSNTFVVTNAMVRPAGFACASDVFSTNHTFVAPCVLTVDFTSDQTSVCAGKSVVYTDATTGGIPQSYYWDFGAGATPTTATTAGPHTVTYTKSGTPTVRLVIDSLIATKNAVFKSLVTVNAKPVVTILASGGTTFCSGATVKLSTAASGTIYKWYNNGVLLSPNSNNLEVTTSGKYNVMVTSSNTCSDSALTSAVVTVNQSPVITRVDSTSITNCGVNDGSINVTATGSNIEYSIGNIIFQASNLFQNLSAGSYTAVVRNVGGTCPVTFPQVLPIKGMKQANILLLDKTNPQNCGVNDGSITINTDMPTSGLQFSIDSGITWQPSNQFSGLVGATYKVAIKNSDGKCVVKSTQNAVITAPSAATIVKVIPVDPSDCGLTNGSITINATGGIAPLQYSIDNGATFQEGNVFNNLSGKTYNIVVTNANGGCKVNHTSSIVIAGKTAPVISSVEPTPPSSCLLNNGTITISATGNSGTLQYSIDGGTEWKNSPTFTSLAPGDYFVSIQYDNNTCQVTQTSAVAIAALGSPTITIDKTELCADTISTANLQAMPTGGTWSLTSGPGTGKINGSTYLSGSTGAPATIKYMLPNGCANTKQVLNVAMPETVAITSDKDRLCKTTESGMVINLNPAESGVNYFLKYNLNTIDSIIGSGASNTFKPQKNAGRYITQAVRKGNTVTCKVNLDTLTLIPTPVFVLKDTLSIGCGTSTDLTLSALRAGSDANATYKYFVDRSALTPLSNPSSINLAGNYFVQMTSSTCKLLDSIYVKQLNDLELKITNPPAFGCGNVADVTTASITQGSSLGGNLTYFKDQNGTSELTVPQNITAGGTYYIKLSKGNCSRIAAVVVEFENTLNLTITNPDPVNCGMPVDIMLPAVTAGSNSGLLTYLADTVTGEILNNPNRVMLPGEYFIMLSSGQCKTIKSVYVLLNGTPNLKINPPPAVCSPSTIDLKAPAITQGSQDGLTLSYWTSRNADTPIPNPANITQSGTYFIKGSVNSSCGIMLGVSVTINKGPTLSNVITGGLVCFGNDVPVTVASTIDTISYQPFFGSVAAGPAQLGNNGVLTFTIPNNLLQTGSEPFMVRASTPNCPSVPLTDTAVVAQVEQLLALDKIMGKLEVCKNENWVYKATNSRGYNLEWSLPDFATITQEYEGTDSIKLNFPIDIITADSLGVRTIKGKCKSPSTKLEIKAKKDCNLIFIPNVLTSSPSDNNSVWSIEGINSYPRSNIKVYNRWGTEVFASRGQTYKSWNGTTSSGSPLPTATYYFVIDLNDDERRSYTGSVTIVRE